MKNNKSFGGDKPRKFGPSANSSFPGKPGAKGKSSFGGSKPAFGKKKPFGASKGPGSFEKREHTDDRPRRPYGDARPGGFEQRDRNFSDRKPSFGRKPFGGGESRSEGDASERRPFAPKKPGFGPSRQFGAPRPGGYQGRSGGSDSRPGGGYQGRSAGTDSRPGGYGSGERTYGDKPRKSFGAPRPEGGRSEGGYEQRDRPYGDKPKFGGPKPYGASRPSYGSPKPSYGSPKPSFGSPKPAYGSPKPAYGSPKPAYGSPKPFGSDRSRFSSDRPERSYDDKPKFDGPKDRGYTDRRPSKPFTRDRDEREHRSEPRKRFDDAPRARWEDQAPSQPKRRFEELADDFSQEAPRHSEVSVPFNKKNHEEGFVRKPFPDLKTKTFLPGLTAKKLIVTLEDTGNVPVRLVWIYESMVGLLPDGEPSAGDTVHIHDANDRFLGSAIYNPNSKIRARIFSVSRQVFNETYIINAINEAVSLRKSLGLLDSSCRVIFGDADGLPGLIADKIGDFLVIQPLTYAIDRRLNKIIDHLNETLGPQGIIVRNDAPIRAKEGLPIGEIVTHGEIPGRVKVTEDGCILFADPAGGQKTGLFLDQRLNRAAIKPFCKDAKVLDLFCHVGGWAMRAAKYGAKEVIGVDSSKPALEMAKDAAKANGFEQVSFVDGDVFDYLKDLNLEPDELFDVIICDPPAFAKTRAHYEDAFRAYLSLNYLVMKKLKPGGILVSCSCSQAVSSQEFGEALLTAARNSRMQFQIIERRGAPQDHPVLLGLPETDYLKCFVLRRTE